METMICEIESENYNKIWQMIFISQLSNREFIGEHSKLCAPNFDIFLCVAIFGHLNCEWIFLEWMDEILSARCGTFMPCRNSYIYICEIVEVFEREKKTRCASH